MQIPIFTRDNLSKKSPVLIAVPKPVALFISETMLNHFGLNLISDPLRFETQGLLSENFLVKTKAGQKVVKWRKGGPQTRKRLIKELELTEKWSFNMLGADFNVDYSTSTLNFQARSVGNYSKDRFHHMRDDIDHSMRRYADSKSKGIIDKSFLKGRNKK